MSEMVERVARAIAKDRGEDWSKIRGGLRAGYMSNARAVIEAMREPTEDMIEQGFIRPPQWDHDSATVLDVYQAMIDEALK